MDAAADRDFAIEYILAAVCMMHLSRLAEEIIMWSSAEFKFIELTMPIPPPSLMLQKKTG